MAAVSVKRSIADNTHLDWLTKLYNDCCHSFMTTHIQAGNIH